MIFNYFEKEKRHGVEEIPDEVIAEFRHKDVFHIDFSSNSLASMECLSYFLTAHEIILDNNFLSDQTAFPAAIFHNAHVLSLNNNKLENLNQLIQNVCTFFPNIRYLSLLGNPLCPLLSENFNEEDYQNYRLFIISRLPKLKFLDAKVIKMSEWSLIHSDVSIVEEVPVHSDTNFAMERVSLWKKIFGGKESQSNVNRKAYTPLPTESNGDLQPKATYGRLRHVYKGTESQGNRFIGNTML